DVLFSAYVTSGQRCSATSRALVHRSLVDLFTARMAELVKTLVVGDPSRADVFMGAVTTAAGLEKFLAGCAEGEREGAEAIVPAGRFQAEHTGHYAQPALHRVNKIVNTSKYQREELFGPDLAIYAIDDLDQGIAMA